MADTEISEKTELNSGDFKINDNSSLDQEHPSTKEDIYMKEEDLEESKGSPLQQPLSSSMNGDSTRRDRDASVTRARSRSHRHSSSLSRSRSRGDKRRNSRRHRRRSYSRDSDSRSRSRTRRGRERSRDRSGSRDRDVSRGRRRSRRDQPAPSHVLGVFNLSLKTRERDLQQIFEQYGKVNQVMIVYDHRTDRSRGFGFVYMDSVEDATLAKDKTNGMLLNSRNMRVDYSLTQRAHTPTPGEYMGDRRHHIRPAIAGVAVAVIGRVVVVGLVLGGSPAVLAAPEDLGADRGDLEVIRANLVSV
ncbi:6035_t:CDS:2 [Paraglomus brasilianum]|uniref:6035_t:CDS:1 n=1 Tax=Paraglomus brasilianum TaxID=144538 RepID=A0A9N9FZG9_9GLOM|nr:6035_t:CDS:2 [Paraglomus brasilianum]